MPARERLDEEVVVTLIDRFREMADAPELRVDDERDEHALASVEALVYMAAGWGEQAADAMRRALDGDDVERSLYAAVAGWASATRAMVASEVDGDDDDLFVIETDSNDDQATAIAALMSAFANGDNEGAMALWRQFPDNESGWTDLVDVALQCLMLAGSVFRQKVDEAMSDDA